MHQPPKFHQRLFSLICASDYYEELQGDLMESYRMNLKTGGRKFANANYKKEVFKMCRPSVLKKPSFNFKFLPQPNMILNYSKITIRNIVNNKLFSAINIIGLAISMSVGLLIITMVADQYSFDNFQENKDRIYRFITHTTPVDTRRRGDHFATTSYPLGEIMMQNPLVEKVVRFRRYISGDVTFNNIKKIPMQGHFTEQSFFDVFTYELIQGDPKTALKDPQSLIFTEEAAKRLFGQEDALDKVVSIGKYGDFKVTGIMKDIPRNSHFKFEILASASTLPILENKGVIEELTTNWMNFWEGYVYILLKQGADPESIKKELERIGRQRTEANNNYIIKYELQGLRDITPGIDLANQIGPTIETNILILLSILAAVVIFSACFNYTNLSIARALKRAKEVGIRKVVGSNKGQIFWQFITEAIIISLLALLLSVLLFTWIRSGFYQTFPVDMTEIMSLDITPKILIYFTLFATVTGFLAGFLPSLILTKVQPAQILKSGGRIKLMKGVNLRKTLIVIQFTISLVLIIIVTVTSKQYKFVTNYDIGFNSENILNVKLQGNDHMVFANEFTKIPEVSRISFSSHVLGTGTQMGTYVKFKDLTDSTVVSYMFSDRNYLVNHEIPFLAGNNFPENIPESDNEETMIIVNQKFLELYGVGNPADVLEEEFKTGHGTTLRVIGVVKDFHFVKLSQALKPFFIMNNPKRFNVANLKVASRDILQLMGKLDKSWQKIDFKVHPFEAGFYDQQLADAYRQYTVTMRVLGFIAFLAISIACLGLVGMAVYNSESRLKEIGIRKVMGASVQNLVYLLTKGFVKLSVVASIIAITIAYFMVEQVIMGRVAYKAPLSVLDYGLGVLILVFLVFLITGSQTWTASRASPVNTLRNE